jgi:hypothetical protein
MRKSSNNDLAYEDRLQKADAIINNAVRELETFLDKTGR